MRLCMTPLPCRPCSFRANPEIAPLIKGMVELLDPLKVMTSA